MEEQKVYKEPMQWQERLRTLSTANLAGESARLSRHPESKLGGGIADILLITVFHRNIHGNDPYLLRFKSMQKKTYDCYHAKVEK